MRTSILALPLVLAATSSVFACSDDATSAAPGVDGGGGASDAASSTDGGGAQADGTTDASVGGDGIGPGPYTIVYAGSFVGIDGRPVADGKATFADGALTGYTATGQETEETPLIGSNTAKETASTSLFAIGRWSGGTTDGKFYEADAAGKMTFAANAGLHYAIGRPSDPIPSSGLVAYTVDKKTAATTGDGAQAPGTIAGALALNLAGASTKIGLSVTIDIPGSGTYTAETTGGVADPAQSDAELLAGDGPNAPKAIFFFNKNNIANAGSACAGGSCALGVDGVIVGPNAENVLIVAHFYSGSGGSPTSVSGAIAFKK